MTAIARSISFVGIIATLFACGHSFPFSGKWNGSRKLIGQPNAREDVLNTLKRVTVRVGNDGRFELFNRGMSTAGKTASSGSELVLNPDTVMDRPLSQQPPEVKVAIRAITLSGNADGTVTFREPGEEPLILNRESQP